MENDFWKHTVDFLGLSTETKPTENVVDGSTFYEVDTVKLYVFIKEHGIYKKRQKMTQKIQKKLKI